MALINGTNSDNTLNGSNQADEIFGLDGNDLLNGNDGDDSLYGGRHNDTLNGGRGADLLNGGTGEDVLNGGTGNDTLNGGDQNDVLNGEDGDDLANGGAGDDLLNGGRGNDTLYGDNGSATSSVNLIQNGSFENFDLGSATVQPWGFSTTTLTGWMLESGPQFEIVDSGHRGVASADGAYWLDFDATPGNIAISQVVAGVVNGENYVLHLDAANTPSGNAMEVYWGGVLLGTINPASTAMEAFNFTVVGGAGDGTNTLRFVGTGPEDNVGVSLDNVTLFAQNDSIGHGNDTVNGGTGNDLIYGGAGNDLLNGDDGSDSLFGETGNDTINGGAGLDLLWGGTGNDQLYGNTGNDTLNGEDGEDSLYGGDGDDQLNGGRGADLLHGGRGNDTLDGGTGSDQVHGDTGDDSATGGDGNDFVFGEDGNDTLNGGRDNDQLFGGRGNDSLLGDSGDDTINGGTGADTLRGGDGHDLLLGEDGNDEISGGNGNDTAFGGRGDDWIQGGAGDDSVLGGSGNDMIIGDDGMDTLRGEDGNDTIHGGNDMDEISGGRGDDTAFGEDGDDWMFGGSGNDSMDGGEGNDMLKGNAGDDTLSGNNGDDTIIGDDTDDTPPPPPPVDNTITVSAFGGNGDPVAMTFSLDDNCILLGEGVTGGRYQNELDYFLNTDSSERVEIDFGASNVTSATVDVSLFYVDPRGFTEIGFWQALDGDGNVVGAGMFTADDVFGVGDGKFQFTVEIPDGFKSLVFTARDNGNRADADNSDYHIDKVLFTTKDITPTVEGGSGGNDVLNGNDGNDVIYGMGGNDTITGGTDRGHAEMQVEVFHINDDPSCKLYSIADEPSPSVDGGDQVDNIPSLPRALMVCSGDILTGNTGADLFVYAQGDGVDIVTDFTVGLDKLKLLGVATDFADLASHMLNLGASGTALFFGADAAIILEGVDIHTLTASDFQFA